ncbi:MAG: sialate O-acetylesterase [Dysgonamonadaceae bacterium]|jgi:sialate O-acetylesterase|nr:sialate O-acetylesterase [Dysgonamonadaceae bacterium]
MKRKLIVLIICFSAAIGIRAEIRIAKIFTDNMVLQQQTEVPVWGKTEANKGIKLITSWDNQPYHADADSEGKWTVRIKTPKAGGPYSITVSGKKDKIIIKNILIGEVWICSGQSNMEMPLAGWGKVKDWEQEIADADFPAIRLFTVEKNTSVTPLEDLKESNGKWQECSPETVAEFSSVAYFFGRHLYRNLNVPLGLVNTSWGGTVAEAWTSRETVEMIPDFAAALDRLQKQEETDAVKRNPNRVTVLYNAMIYPLVPFTVGGAIWYQGESNADRAYQYCDLFPLMIQNWRSVWGKNFPFYFVQLANFMERKPEPQSSRWAELREAQLRTLRLQNTGMAVTVDIGDEKDIHPKNKQDVGLRLALNALAKTYGKQVSYSGPVYRSYQIEGDKIRVKFEDTATGLKTSDGNEIRGFAIAGADHVFHWATATAENETEVTVGSSYVKYPVAVRYAWADNPECNLTDSSGLPASPFRTDDWK